MIHHSFKVFHEHHPDLATISHFDFFDSAPHLSEADACDIWMSSLAALAKDADPATKALVESLREMYLKDMKIGILRQYWDRRKLEYEVEKSKNEVTIQTVVTVNHTTAKVTQSVEKQASGRLEKIGGSILLVA
ncbi:hypothetical protein DFQ26_002800, partial [Actinomortierella ambigua]